MAEIKVEMLKQNRVIALLVVCNYTWWVLACHSTPFLCSFLDFELLKINYRVLVMSRCVALTVLLSFGSVG